ncbi:MAG TPA: type II secretion system F family protein [Methylovirgula sp.]|nr:type II secretion system F family protein [Methylovirgula sp.]
MPRLKYTTMALDGSCITQEREVDDAMGFAHELERQGLIVVSTQIIKDSKSGFSLRGRIAPRVVTSFLRELSLIVRSGLPLVEALDLAAQDVDSRLAEAVRSLRRDIVAGSSFHHALEKQHEIFTPDIVAMARVAEATGELDKVFRALATERERNHALIDKVTNALRYPLFLICAATLVLLFFMLHVIPQFSSLFADQNHAPNGLVSFVFGTSDWLVANQTALMIGGIATLALGLVAWRMPIMRGALMRGFAQLPVIGSLFVMRRSALLLSNLSILLAQGVPLIEALRVIENLVGAEAKADFAKVIDVVRQGGRLNQGLTSVDMLPALAVRMLKIGEETGELARTAGEAGQLYMDKLEKRLEQVTAFVGPIAILFIAGMIGTMMVAVMMSILSVNDLAL